MEIEPIDEDPDDEKGKENKYIKTLEDSGINVEIEPTDEDPDDKDENRGKNKSIETLED